MMVKARFGLQLAFGSLLLTACNTNPVPRAQDRDEIIRLVLVEQYDGQAAYDAEVQEMPGFMPWYSRFFDWRTCVVTRTRGSAPSMPSTDVIRFSHSPPPDLIDGPAFDFSVDLLPDHLQPKRIFSQCPSGWVELSNPEFEGDTAHIHSRFENPWGGDGTDYRLRKVAGEWEILDRESRIEFVLRQWEKERSDEADRIEKLLRDPKVARDLDVEE